MTYDQYNEFCSQFAATSYVRQWGDADVWKVGGKVFAVGGWNKADSPTVTFKTSPLNFEFLLHKEHYRPAPYLASRGMKWIQQFCAPSSLDDELRYYIEASYHLVASGLSKKKQRELGIILKQET